MDKVSDFIHLHAYKRVKTQTLGPKVTQTSQTLAQLTKSIQVLIIMNLEAQNYRKLHFKDPEWLILIGY